MYEEHPSCIEPENKNIKIWRFIDFSKFVSMLINNSLYFSGLKNMKDQFEGTYSNITLKKMKKAFQEKGISEEILKRNFKELPEMFSRLSFLNCWHMSEHEPSSMWKNYIDTNQGIAIQSTYRKLRDSFTKSTDGINISQIKYIDYDRDEMKWGNMMETLIHKRINFSDEREIRSILIKAPVNTGRYNLNDVPKGYHVPVDLDILIESITMAPNASSWMFELVNSVLEKFTLKKPVYKSKMDELPPNI